MNSPMFAQRTSGNSAKAPAEPYAACGAAHGLSLPFGNSRLWPSTELYYANFSREQWIIHKKLILVLDDQDVEAMLIASADGRQPEEIIGRKIQEFPPFHVVGSSKQVDLNNRNYYLSESEFFEAGRFLLDGNEPPENVRYLTEFVKRNIP